MKDGMSSEEIVTGSLIAGVGSVTGLLEASETIGSGEIEAGAVDSSELAAQAVNATKQGFVGASSPIAYGLAVEAGTVLIPAAGSVWQTFSTPFLANPNVAVGFLAPMGSTVSITSRALGSVLFQGDPGGAVGSVSWIAVGSR